MRVFMGLLMLGVLAGVWPAMAGSLSWTFTPEGWNPDEWILVKSPRCEHFGKLVQKEEHLIPRAL